MTFMWSIFLSRHLCGVCVQERTRFGGICDGQTAGKRSHGESKRGSQVHIVICLMSRAYICYSRSEIDQLRKDLRAYRAYNVLRSRKENVYIIYKSMCHFEPIHDLFLGFNTVSRVGCQHWITGRHLVIADKRKKEIVFL